MMRNFSETVSSSISGETTTFCHCVLITTVDDLKLGFTDHDCSLQFQQIDCSPVDGMEVSEAHHAAGFAPGNADIIGVISSQKLKSDDIRFGRFDGAHVEVWRVDWKDPDTSLLEYSGVIGNITEEDEQFRAEVLGPLHHFDAVRGRRYQYNCDACLGDKRCGVSMDDPKYRLDTFVAEGSTRFQIYVNDLANFEPTWFDFGGLVYSNPNSSSIKRDIQSCRKKDDMYCIDLRLPLSIKPEAGNQVTLYAGCSKDPETCKDKFKNIINYQGFPNMPGNDFVLRYPRRG